MASFMVAPGHGWRCSLVMDARRPLKSRATAWARAVSKGLLALGVRPNAVSVASVFFAAVAAGLILFAASEATHGVGETAAWIGAALAIQLQTPFPDHAVLQRDMAVPVWGWS